MNDRVRIPEYCVGPPAMGNGGYVAGAFAAFCDEPGPVEVTLRSPVPLEKDLLIERGEGLVIMDDVALVAEVRAGEIDMEIPEPPTWEEAASAKDKSFSFGDRDNPLFPGRQGFHPICFCCGVENDRGLKVFAAPVMDNAQVAAIWATQTDWVEEGREDLAATHLWTALDCPGQFAYMADGIRTGLLGRLTAEIIRPVKAGQELMVTGWRIGVEGKKHFAGTAVFTRDRELVARAKAVWIGTQIQPIA